jgi:alkanesulfonate monooxygenase SsuD/methylene tetrahydromethanopterin reductase-like flavin-dependent oxidoreductase (luciferase family)
MIEFFTIDNGPTDIPLTLTTNGVTVPAGDLHAMHASRQRAVINQVRKAALAEQLGFHYFFLTEHHFQPEGAEFSPNPLLMGAAIAMQTRRIRIGQLANILPWHHPVRLAEQAAMVDVLSGGRLEFGVGRGVQPRETEVFGQVYGSTTADEQRSRLYHDECLEIILKAWTESSFSYRGEFYSIPPRWTAHHHPMTIEYFSQPGVGRTVDDVLQVGEPTNVPAGVRSHATRLKELSVFPQPLQKPYPQLWQPNVMNMSSLKRSARAGINVIFLTIEPSRVRDEVATYHAEAEQHGFPDLLDRGAFAFGWDSARKRGVVHAAEIHIVDHGIGDAHKFELAGQHLWGYLRGFNPTAPVGPNRGGAPDLRPRMCGSSQQLIDGLMGVKESGGYADFPCCVLFGGPGFTWEEEEEQMHAFAQDVMPVLVRECGGTPTLPEPSVQWT